MKPWDLFKPRVLVMNYIVCTYYIILYPLMHSEFQINIAIIAYICYKYVPHHRNLISHYHIYSFVNNPYASGTTNENESINIIDFPLRYIFFYALIIYKSLIVNLLHVTTLLRVETVDLSYCSVQIEFDCTSRRVLIRIYHIKYT